MDQEFLLRNEEPVTENQLLCLNAYAERWGAFGQGGSADAADPV
jgi:hypothetical protein